MKEVVNMNQINLNWEMQEEEQREVVNMIQMTMNWAIVVEEEIK